MFNIQFPLTFKIRREERKRERGRERERERERETARERERNFAKPNYLWNLLVVARVGEVVIDLLLLSGQHDLVQDMRVF